MSFGMGKTGILLLIVCTCCTAERLYFPQHNASTWEVAQQHCQLCYKELVSLTSDNIQLLVQNLSSRYWVGLRKNLSSPTFWSRWTNGDPLTFQNWYPGHPKSPQPNMCTVNLGDVCKNINTTEQMDVCVIQVEEFCMNTTIFTPEYVPSLGSYFSGEEVPENPCVSLLSSGMWIEEECTELLPFICYEDCFYGKVTVSNKTLNSMTVSWLAGPGNIDLYMVEVRGDIHLMENTTNLTMNFRNLTPGTKYIVQVFPVKCERVLNPQNVTFYTKPDHVRDLSVINVTKDSAFLSWIQPVGNHSCYKVKVIGHSSPTPLYVINEYIKIETLRPGQNYNFIVNAEVEDPSLPGDSVSISTYTKPEKVGELTVSKKMKNAALLNWTQPEGSICCYRVIVRQEMERNNSVDKILVGTSLQVGNLTAGTKFQVNVSALAGLILNDSVEGEPDSIMYFVEPSPVTNLYLSSTSDMITANWNPPDGNFDFYRLMLKQGSRSFYETTTNDTFHIFQNLNSAINYTVTIYTELMQNSLKSDGVSKWKLTLPMKPENLLVFNRSKTSMSLKWDVPEKMQDSIVYYGLKFTAAFWDETKEEQVQGNKVTLQGLRPGTKYTFEVRTLASNLSSESVSTSALTEPNKANLSLMIQCSSKIPQFCEYSNTKKRILQELNKIVNETLKDQVYWRLEWKPTSSGT